MAELRKTLGEQQAQRGEQQAQRGEQTKDQEERAWTVPGLGRLCACSDALSGSKTKQAHSDAFSQLYSPCGSMDGDFNKEKALSIRAGKCCRKALWCSRKGRACGRKLGCEAQPHPFLCV